MSLLSKVLTLDETCHEIAHTWTPSCPQAWLDGMLIGVKSSVTIYIPLFLLLPLARKKKLPHFKSFARNVIHSTVFLSLNGTLPIMFCCAFRHILKKFYFLTVAFIPGFFAGFLAILTEQKSRRVPLTMYVISVAFESLIKSSMNHGWIRKVENLEVYIFSLASAFIMYFYRSNQLNGFLGTMIRYLLQEKTSSLVGDTRVLSLAMTRHWVISSGKAFIFAYVIKSLLSFVSSVEYWIQSPRRLLRILKSKSNLGFGAYVGSYVALFKVIEFVLSRFRQGQGTSNAFIAGGIAGLSMIFHKSYGIATSSAIRVLEILIKKRFGNSAISRFPNYALLNGFALGTSLHILTMEPHCAPKAFSSFVAKLTGGRTNEFNRKKLDYFGCESSKSFQLLFPKHP